MRVSIITAGIAAVGAAAQQNYLGFNSGATKDDHSAKFKEDFVAEFRTARNLEGAPGTFSAVRLYTNIQAYSEDDPIEAFEAAVETDTNILLGVWASGTDNIDKEITALKKAVDNLGTDFTDLVIGISIGSEDLYRISETGIKNKAGVGNSPQALVGFIEDFRDAFSDTPLAGVPVGHVDTWDIWPNTTNKPVLDAVDWVGVNSFPYYESGKGNSIDNAPALFDRSYATALAVVGDKPVWITETGWPASGPDWDEAEASLENAKYYWDEVGCRQLFGKTPTFWYILRDSNPDNEMKFAVTKNLNTKPLFNLTCPTTFDTPTNTPTTALPSSTSSAGSSPSSTSGSGSNSDSDSSSGSGSGSGSNSDSDSDADREPAVDGDDETVNGNDDSAASGRVFSAATCVGLALVAGVFSLF
ncbi:glycoside hydrolase family 17 protein [Sodiomyces alcalophilus JCM 7366]|uniref:glycoside hydrolase family 17 protein n=1 Tax=Sodiomyces alcalophilus JCM 7366 TaxID=591952 RepID=UPI0039B6C4F4